MNRDRGYTDFSRGPNNFNGRLHWYVLAVACGLVVVVLLY